MIKELLIFGIIQIVDIIGQPPNPYDEYGCCVSCGFSWCPDLNRCVRLWETYCKSLDNGH
mgnify:CR=1 FL=1|tara:strand:+ start:9942 stop:10121 length:180 start_codon:yes stop_codon:yes gene_type:complete